MVIWSMVPWVAAAAGPEMVPLPSIEVVGQQVATAPIALREGGTFDLAERRGRVVVVSFWASWCGPCRLELPALSEYAATRKDVDFIAVNVDRQTSAAEGFLWTVHVSLPIAWDTEAAMLGEFGVLSMPTTFVVDASGVVRHKKVGYSQERGLTELVGYIDEVTK